MSHNVNLQHIVFRTRYSHPTIPGNDNKMQLLTFIISESKRLSTTALWVNAHLNHVHILVDLGANMNVADYVKAIKANSSRAFKGNCNFPLFDGWAKKYGSFSISRWDKEKIIGYIRNQEEHHRYKTFAEELAELFGEDAKQDAYWRQDWLDEEVQ